MTSTSGFSASQPIHSPTVTSRLVAGHHAQRCADAAVAGQRIKMRAVGAGLAGDADASRNRPAAVERRRERCVIRAASIENAQAVGAEDTHAGRAGRWRPCVVCASAPASSISAKPAVNITTAFTPRAARSSIAGAASSAGTATIATSGVSGRSATERIGLQPLDLRSVGIDGIKAAGEALGKHIGDRAAADPRRIGGGAEDGDGTGCQKRCEAGETRHEVDGFQFYDATMRVHPGPGVILSQLYAATGVERPVRDVQFQPRLLLQVADHPE